MVVASKDRYLVLQFFSHLPVQNDIIGTHLYMM